VHIYVEYTYIYLATLSITCHVAKGAIMRRFGCGAIFEVYDGRAQSNVSGGAKRKERRRIRPQE
jgi:hypothetical protein